MTKVTCIVCRRPVVNTFVNKALHKICYDLAESRLEEVNIDDL